MNKKILTSLLMTPLAFGAMADIANVVPIPLDSKDWTQTGISSTDVFLATGGVNCPIESGQLEYKTPITLSPGTYKLVFEQAKNVAVQINGEEYPLSNGAATFTIEEKTDVKLVVVSLNKQAGFSFNSIRLDLVFDFDAAAEHFEAQLPTVHALNNPKSALLEEYKNVTVKVAEIQGRINKVADKEAQKKAYDDEELWNYPASDKITSAINELKESGKVEALNTKIDWDNTVYALNETVTKYKGDFNNAIEGIDEKQAYRDDVVKYAEASRDAEADEMQKLIDDFTAEVADGTITEADFNKKLEELRLTLQDYSDEINGFINDAKAYYDMQASYNNLRDTYTKSLGALFGLQGVKGEYENKDTYDYADAFNALNAEWQKALNDHLAKGTTPVEEIMGAATKGEDGKYVFDGQKIEGAAANLEDGQTQKAVDDAIAAMEELVGTNTDKVGTQGELMTAAVVAIHAQQVLLPMNMVLPGNLAKETIELNNRLNALLKKVEDAYAQLSLSEETYATELAVITNDIKDLDPVMTVFNNYKALVEEINKNVNVEGSVINGKFSGSLSAIWESISTYDNAGTSSTKEIENAIKKTLENAEKLVKAQKDAQAVLDEYTNIVEEQLNAEIVKVNLLEGVDADKVKVDSGYTDFVEESNGYKEDFKAVAELEAQECYEALVQLAKDLNAEKKDFTKRTIELKKSYVEAAMVANKAFVEAEYNATLKHAGTEKFLTDLVGKIKGELDNVATTVAATSTDPVGEANKAHDDLKEILEELGEINKTIDQYWDNDTWASDRVNDLTDLADKIADAKETNEKTSWDPAKSKFAEVLNGYEKARTDLLAKVENALANLKVGGSFDAATATEKFDKEAVEKEVADLITKVEETSGKIIPNHDAYVGLLGTAETTRNAIQDAQELLDKSLKDSGISPEDVDVKKWQDDINIYMERLTELNRQLGDLYGTGVADANKDALTTEYNNLRADALKLMNGEDGINNKFGNVVATANGAYLEMWSIKYDDLRDEYTQTLNAFNAYGSKNITNTDYYQYLLENVVIEGVKVLGDHTPIYDYTSQITELNNVVTDFINGQSADKKAVTDSEYAEKATTPADAYINGMQGLVNEMKTQAAQYAQVYFETITAEAQAKVDAAQAAMKDAGCSNLVIETYTKAAQDIIDAQSRFHEESLGKADLVLAVNTIATELEKISIDEKAAAQAAWDETFGADTKNLADMSDAIDGFKYVQDDENIAEFNEANAAVEAMAGVVVTNLETLKTSLADLTKQYDAAVAAYIALDAKEEAAKLADTTTATFIETIGELRGENEALNEYADGLAGSPADADIAAKIDAIEDDVKNSKDIVADKADIEESIEKVKEAIANGYTSLVESEHYKLDGLMAKILDAYQVVAEKMTPEDAAAKKTEIDELQKAVDDLYNANKDGITDQDDYKAKAQALETTLADEYVNLSGAECPELTDARTAIDAKYQEVLNAVNNGKAALGELVKDKYESQYDILIEELGNIDEKVQGAGNELFLYQDTYVSQIAAVAAELEALNAEAAAAQKAAEEKAAIAETTAANVEALNAKLDEARTALGAARTQVTEWGVEEWNTFLNTLDGCIETIGGDITAEGTITEENADGITEAEMADLLDAIGSLYTEMNYYVEMAATNYASNANKAANKAISDARDALTGATVVNSAELSRDIDTQAVALETANNTLSEALAAAKDTEAKVAAYETFAEAAKKVEATVADIIEEIANNTYILGDVDGSEGEPDANDVMTLLGWIGQKLTLDDLANEATAEASDINGDGKLDIADAAALFRLIMTEPGQRPARIVAARSGEGDAIYALTRTGEEAGSRIYSLSLNNSGDFVGAQVDIKLPAGMTLVDAQMTERASGHDVQVYDNGNGNYRLLIFSAENATFQGNAGELLNLTIEGIGTPIVEEMVLSTPACAAVLGHAADTNMIDSIIEGAHNMKERIYNAAGQSLRAVQRGINIIRHSDGSTTKELHK